MSSQLHDSTACRPCINTQSAPALHHELPLTHPPRSLRRSLRRFFIRPLLTSRAKRLTPLLMQILGPDTSLLDLGCGDMILTEYLQKKSSTAITPLDTVDSNLSRLPLTIYNGRKIPFANKAFDATLVSFVLHHCNDIPSVLNEIKRVTTKKIIILEELYGGTVSRKLLHLHDYGNRFLSSKMDIPLNFLTMDKWMHTFEQLGLTLRQSRRIYQYPAFNVTHQVLFELQLS